MDRVTSGLRHAPHDPGVTLGIGDDLSPGVSACTRLGAAVKQAAVTNTARLPQVLCALVDALEAAGDSGRPMLDALAGALGVTP